MKLVVVLVWAFLVFSVRMDDSVLANEFYTNLFTDGDFGSWSVLGNNMPSDHFFTQCGTVKDLRRYFIE
jgi:hypothetical protein